MSKNKIRHTEHASKSIPVIKPLIGVLLMGGIIWGLFSLFQPVSLDLRLGSKAYRIRSSFLPENDTVENKLKDLKQYEVDLREPKGGILERHAIYLIPLQEELDFPDSIYGKTNPKSSTGRLDMFTRLIIDWGHRFDEIPRGYKGKMYLEVIPRTFQVKVFEGLKLNQLRIGYGQPTLMGKKSLEPDYKNNPILFHQSGFEIPIKDIKLKGGLYISVDLSPREDGVVAYKAKQNSSIIDLSKVNHYDPLEFWEPIRPYILAGVSITFSNFRRQKVCPSSTINGTSWGRTSITARVPSDKRSWSGLQPNPGSKNPA